MLPSYSKSLTHWGRVTHICVSKLTIIGSDNGLSPDRHQVIIWTNDVLLLIGPLGTHFSEIFIEILTFSFKKMHLKVSSAIRRLFCLGLNVLTKGCDVNCSVHITFLHPGNLKHESINNEYSDSVLPQALKTLDRCMIDCNVTRALN